MSVISLHGWDEAGNAFVTLRAGRGICLSVFPPRPLQMAVHHFSRVENQLAGGSGVAMGLKLALSVVIGERGS